MKPLLRKCFHSALSLLYPPLCNHCGGEVADPQDRFCSGCLSLLELLDPEERCPKCFSSHYRKQSHYCSRCFRQSSYLTAVAGAFPNEGPALSLLQKLKQSNQPFHAKGLAAFMVAQFSRLDWPMPDAVVPVPMPFAHSFMRGYNQSALLAEEVGKMLGRPVKAALGRRLGDFRQELLPKKEREQLTGSTFFLRKKFQLRDHCLLLIDDSLVTGSTLQRSAEALLQDSPRAIYGLTACLQI